LILLAGVEGVGQSSHPKHLRRQPFLKVTTEPKGLSGAVATELDAAREEEARRLFVTLCDEIVSRGIGDRAVIAAGAMRLAVFTCET
jgi:hypothetical protein